MRLFSKSTAIILLAIFLLCASVGAFASSADALLIEGDWVVKAAQKDTRVSDRNDHYTIALRVYERVAGDNKYAGTPEGALALQKIAWTQWQAKGEAHNLNAAHEALKRLINNYDNIKKSDELTPAEVAQIRSIVADGKKLDDAIRTQLNKENSQKTLYKIMDAMVKATGSRPGFSYWFAIILLTVIIKIVTTPLTKAQFKSMKEMQTIAPLIKEIQEKYKGDQSTIGQKTMELYKEHHINPFASCLPILIQMPILWMMFMMMRQYEFQLQNGTFAWIGSALSHLQQVAIPFSHGTVWLTARNLAEPDLLLLVLYLISMYISTKMSAVDPTQAEQQKMMAIMMPLMFGFIFASYPSAFLLYWLTLNILQTVQQYYILHKPAQAVAGATTTTTVEPAEAPKPEDGRISRGQSGSRRRRRR